MKVLVVDDSALMRRFLRERLRSEGDIDVVTARDGEDALVQVEREQPDVVTLDINMPAMDGLDCLGRLMADSPRPVVMVSSLTQEGALTTFEALELGAVDYVAKPGTMTLDMDSAGDEIVAKVRAAARARVRNGARGISGRLQRRRREASEQVRHRVGVSAEPTSRRPEVIVLGASTGGPGVLADVIGALPANFPVPIVIAQHIPSGFSAALATRLDEQSALRVEEVTASRVLEPGLVLIGRGEADVVLTKRGGILAARSVPMDRGLRWHPSVERLVRSAMSYCDPATVVAVQLTGMGDDGAAAMADLRAAGGRVIAESEETAVIWGMPGEVVRRGAATKVLPVDQVAEQLTRWS
jgi:two-component system chemotaxis response regulator CheB